MEDPLINDILTLGQSLGRHPGRLVLDGEGAVAVRVSEDRVAVTRRRAWLSQLQPGDIIHLDLQSLDEAGAQDHLPQEEVAGAQPEPDPLPSPLPDQGAVPHEDAPLFSWLLALDPALRVAAHVHPVAVDQITASPRARQFADRRTVHNEVLALGVASLLVNYTEPGLALMREVQKKMVLWRDRNKAVPRVILVQNHGVILVAETALALIRTAEALLKYAELFTGASLLGGPVFLTPQAITQIEQHHHGG